MLRIHPYTERSALVLRFRSRSVRLVRATAAALLGVGLSLITARAFAQDEEEEAWDADNPAEERDDEDEPQGEENGESADEAERSTAEEGAQVVVGAELAPRHIADEHRLWAASYRLPEKNTWPPLAWGGGRMYAQTEIDVGYATYRYPENSNRPRETLHDMRGRFVLGPAFHFDFPSSDYFLEVVGQVVAWVREQSNEYQINADDVYAQLGQGKTWDLQVGRFMTWRVYHKGLGFDIFTLEDLGASKSYPISNGNFAVHTYEVDYIFLRNSPYVGGEVAGRAAFHYYPADILGFELAAAYGLADNQASNTVGARLAADLQWDFLRLSAAGEYRRQDQTGPPNSVIGAGTPAERTVACTNCGSSKNYGFGGSAVVSFAPITLGGSFARGTDQRQQGAGNETGTAGPDLAASGTRMSFGGYFELDAGSLLLSRSLILGVGAHRTEYILENFNQEFHLQSAAYVALPLGVNNAMVKLIASQAQADLYDATDPQGSSYIDQHPESTALRLRFSTNF